MNDTMYIGKTIRTLSHRINNHFFNLSRGIHKNPHLQNSYNKYGRKNFECDVLETCSSVSELDQSESFWIAYLKFLGAKLFNCKNGGEAGTVFSDEVRRKISIGNRGKKRTPECRRQMSISRKGNMPLHCRMAVAEANRRRVISQETRDKLSLAQIARHKRKLALI